MLNSIELFGLEFQSSRNAAPLYPCSSLLTPDRAYNKSTEVATVSSAL